MFWGFETRDYGRLAPAYGVDLIGYLTLKAALAVAFFF